MFELNVMSNTPLTPIEDLQEASLQFLKQIGYISKGYDPKTEVDNIQESIPYRLFTECFLGNMHRVWAVEELSAYLGTTKPTVYRHLNKLKAIDILEDVSIDMDGQRKKGYRIRYGDLSKAWSFTEANVELAMQSYRKTVEHLQRLARGG
ncbi:MAG TPA: helix-turn-helix domain-containing protein [Methanomassiliicoccales archaeon]|jgi:DNA-binding transcriptional ArsR family regulator|nr:helix-turn-helix transcriptional regulator [Methanomassiliicoccales archaeon]HOE52512.1 helix-turn-helix domain-containing protein [Methanomassiliicoccales archaeon]HOO03276.1 helix-turn-helix domain-containing protein [Methanomassiliicoccales archaeon]HPD08720.1 helix-turn-helix domain-containing protein [Methanomassiliicoccales archaeon]HQM67168.1 helix-turn-helix domain-containing protein [Methanomassiliicoccales archaeon]